MAKIEVPQELQEQIIDLYVNQQKNRKQIKVELNLPFGDSVVKRILEEHNVPIRSNPGAKAGGRKKQEVSQNTQQQIIKLYEQGYGLDKIVHELQLPFSFDKVRSILKDNGIHIRNCAEANLVSEKKDLRKYSINDNYNFESHNGAYILGLLASDGYLPVGHGAMNRVTLSLQRQDREILEKIAQELEYTGPIYDYEATGGYPASSLSFTSKSLRQKIEAYGIGNNKTFKLKELPRLSDEYMLDFIRGFFDGDGSIYEAIKEKKIGMSITCASYSFLKEMVQYLHEHCNVTLPTIHSVERQHIVYDVRFFKRDTLQLGSLFYDNGYLALARKKQHFLELREKYGD